MRPLNGYVLVKELQNNGSTTPEGIVLPDTLDLAYEIGAVVAVCGGESIAAEGNLVAYHANAGVRIMIEGSYCRWVLESNLLAVLEEDCMGGGRN